MEEPLLRKTRMRKAIDFLSVKLAKVREVIMLRVTKFDSPLLTSLPYKELE